MPVWLYWALEYGKVLTAYCLIMFFWPSVVFCEYLKGKSRTFRFHFCVLAQILLSNTIVLGLGLLHILNQWTVRAAFAGIFIYAVYKMHLIDQETKENFSRLLTGECGLKLFFLRILKKIWEWFSAQCRESWEKTRERLLEYIMLAAVLIYAMIYFSYGAFQDYSYGFGDMYTHHSWIYGLIQGKIFSSGVYPEAMHCVIYMIHVLFGVEVYSANLFLAGIHIMVFFTSIYALLREVLRARYTPFVILVTYLILDVTCINMVFSLSRLQWTLPQEFGLFTQFLCAQYLIRYLRNGEGKYHQIKRTIRRKWESFTAFLKKTWIFEKIIALRNIIFVGNYDSYGNGGGSNPYENVNMLLVEGETDGEAGPLENPDSEDNAKGRRIFFGKFGRNKEGSKRKKDYIIDDNLIMFTLALSASLAIHFYTTIMAFFLCAGFAVFMLPSVFSRRRFWPLAGAVVCSLVISMGPMCGAILEGNHFQGSIGWALNVMSGTDEHDGVRQENMQDAWEDVQSQLFGDEETEGAETGAGTETGEKTGNSASTGEEASGSRGLAAEERPVDSRGLASDETLSRQVMQGESVISATGVGLVAASVSGKKELSAGEKLKRNFLGTLLLLKKMAKGVYRGGYITLYTPVRAILFLIMSACAAVIWLVHRVRTLFDRDRYSLEDRRAFDGYVGLTVASMLFMLVYAAPSVGLPSVVAGARLCSTLHLLLIAVLFVPVDLMFYLFERQEIRFLPSILGVGTCIGVYLVILQIGCYHGYLYFELTRYNAAVNLTNSIMNTFPQYTYTIVSPTDELYQVIQKGWHEELYDFMNKCGLDRTYTLPTEHVFIFVEKRPLEYAQSHFFEGPGWLAAEKYTRFYSSYVSQCPEITASELSLESAEEKVSFVKLQQVYSNLGNRTILLSHVYKWCKEFEKAIGQDMKVYYEDEDFVCYYIHQNPQRLFELSTGR